MVYSAKEKISTYLNEFLNLYVKPYIIQSKINEHRRIIRISKKLNELLFDNIKLLEEMYNQAKIPKKGFNL